MPKSKNRFHSIINFAIIVTFVTIIAFSITLISYIKKNNTEHQVYDDLKSNVITYTLPTSDFTNEECVVEDQDTFVIPSTERTVDFTYLTDANPLINSWIYIPGTGIDYPVVQAIDNSTFLKNDINGDASSAGAIFMDCLNNSTYTDFATIIYGHNRRDGSMFHSLHNYTDASYATEHSVLYIYMDSGEIKEYQLLCTLIANCYDENLYIKETLGDLELISYISDISTNVFAEYNGNRILLLSTCIKGESRRVVVFQEITD